MLWDISCLQVLFCDLSSFPNYPLNIHITILYLCRTTPVFTSLNTPLSAFLFNVRIITTSRIHWTCWPHLLLFQTHVNPQSFTSSLLNGYLLNYLHTIPQGPLMLVLTLSFLKSSTLPNSPIFKTLISSLSLFTFITPKHLQTYGHHLQSAILLTHPSGFKI